MKKSLLLFGFIIFFNIAKAQILETLPEIDGEVAYKQSVNSTNSRSTTYYSVKGWVSNSARFIKASIISTDNVQGKIIAKASFELENQDQISILYTFKIEIDCNDQNYTVHIYDIFYGNRNSVYPPSELVKFNDSLKRLRDFNIHKTAYTLNDKFNEIMFKVIKGINSSF